MRQRLAATILLACSISGFTASEAQSVIEADFQEDFSSQTNVSGTIVAGAILGELFAVSDPSQMRIAIPPNTEVFCLSARTRDGQYWMEGTVSTAGASGDIQIRRKGGWQYSGALANYGIGDFAATVRLGEACTLDAAATILPVSLSPNPDRVLYLALNSQRAIRLNATLAHSNGKIEGVCSKTDSSSRSTAFNFWCRFDVDAVASSQEVKILVSRRMRVGPQLDELTLFFADT